MNIETTEDDIVTRLQVKLSAETDVTVLAIPEDDVEIQPDFGKRKIIVAFASEEAQPDGNTSVVAQDTDITFSVLLQGKLLRGDTGLYNLAAKVKLALVGFRPTDCQQLTYSSFKFVRNDKKIFEYLLDFKTVGVVVEDTEEASGPPFVDVTYIDPPGN